MKANQTVALLPIKENSTRVPGKNFKDFGGKPLYEWILDTLLSSKMIDRVVINTDANFLLQKNELIGNSKIILRSRDDKIRGDNVSMNRVIEDDLDNVASEVYLMTHATNPLLRQHTIEEALRQFNEMHDAGEADSLFSVNKLQSRFYTSAAEPINHDPDNLLPTQDLEPWYEESSSLYIFSKKSFNASRARIGLNPMMFEVPRLESIDIDTADDWELALAVHQAALRMSN